MDTSLFYNINTKHEKHQLEIESQEQYQIMSTIPAESVTLLIIMLYFFTNFL